MPNPPTRRHALRCLSAGAAAIASLGVGRLARAAEKIVFATNWRAQAAHGGFYQAVADGTYAKAGFDVEIRPGGPQINNRPLLPAGRIDFLMTGNLLHHFDNAKQGVPTIAVASMFQKDPQALFAHPDQGYDKFTDLARAPVAWIAKDAQFSLYEDAGDGYAYEKGEFARTPLLWDEGRRALTVGPGLGHFPGMDTTREFLQTEVSPRSAG